MEKSVSLNKDIKQLIADSSLETDHTNIINSGNSYVPGLGLEVKILFYINKINTF
jgi:hypothetical protein